MQVQEDALRRRHNISLHGRHLPSASTPSVPRAKSEHNRCRLPSIRMKARLPSPNDGCQAICKSLGCVMILVLCLYKSLFHLARCFGGGCSKDCCLLGLCLFSHYDSTPDSLEPRVHIDSYPLVTVRASRKKIIAKSRFLDEILTRHGDISRTRSHSSTNGRIEQSVKTTQVSNIDILAFSQSIVPLGSELTREGCHPGWLCRCCLSSSKWGSFQACGQFCSDCYSRLLCDAAGSEHAVKWSHSVHLDMLVSQVPAPHVIPRIVHQEFHEPITPVQYPELHRFQNSWRATGWEYRFYTPGRARIFVAQHFPSIVLEAYDTLASKQEESNLFRLLVLLKEGGVYADIDILLETNLDTLLDEQTSFAVARDDSLDGSRDHCLWNGMIAAAPGHPFLVQAVKGVISRVLDKWNDEELDSYVCSSRMDPLWKLRAASHDDNAYGSCALGMAVQAALDRQRLEKFQTGEFSFQEEDDARKVLILMMSLDDMGALRGSDMDRNLLVFSTKHLGLSKESLSTRSRRQGFFRKQTGKEVK